jgi:hypothetical protein
MRVGNDFEMLAPSFYAMREGTLMKQINQIFYYKFKKSVGFFNDRIKICVDLPDPLNLRSFSHRVE